MTAAAMTMLLLKASVLLAAAFLMRGMLRAGPAVRRHGVWSAAFAGLLALPLLMVALPPLDVPVLSSTETSKYRSLPSVGTGETNAGRPIVSEAAQPHTVVTASETRGLQFQLPSLRTTILVTWLIGAAVALIALLTSFARVRRLASSGVELNDAAWRAARTRVASRLGYGHTVRIIACDSIRTPMAGGLLRATVFVPRGATAWDDQRRDIVLAHEIAHLDSRDPLRNLVSRLACTLYWFHPLVWLAVRESAADCEQACDERVLSLGVRPSTYADLLLDFAAGPILNPKVAVPMVRRARLEQRLMSILENRQRPVARRTIVPATVAFALTLSLAAARPVARVQPISLEAPVTSTAETAVTATAAPTVKPTVTPTVPPTVTAALGTVAAECWGMEDRSRDFRGSMSTRGSTIYEQIGRRGTDRVIQTTFGDLRICMVTDEFDGDRDDRPSQWPLRSDRVIMETRLGNDVRTLDVDNGRLTYAVNGVVRPVDGNAQEWRSNLMALFDAVWDLSQLHGRVSSMRGEISSIYGERSSLQGQISSLRGHVSSLRGEISSIRGHESSLRGQISSIRGHESSLKGQISSERGAISSLRGMSWERAPADIESRIRRHEDNIRRIEREILDYDVEARVREVQREIDTYNTERRVYDVEMRIRDFDVEKKIAAVQKELDELEVEGRVNGIEGEIRAMDVPARSRDLEARRDDALARLRRTLRG
jgi:beta-lactamase regulating signal transducer with metallopeptidase domain